MQGTLPVTGNADADELLVTDALALAAPPAGAVTKSKPTVSTRRRSPIGA